MAQIQVLDEEVSQPWVECGTTSYKPDTMRELNLSAGGALLHLGKVDALVLIERVVSNDEGWNNERNKSYRVASASDSDQMDVVTKQIELLNKKIELMGMGQPGPEPQEGVAGVNYVHQGGNNKNFNNYCSNQGGGNYNQYGNKVHPNLSYGNPNNALQPPPGFQVSNGMVKETKKPELEDVLTAFMKQTDKYMAHSNQRLEKVETDVQSLSTHMKSIDTQMSQIAQAVSSQHTPGQFPGQPNVNPKDCKAIHLRSGKSYEGSTYARDHSCTSRGSRN